MTTLFCAGEYVHVPTQMILYSFRIIDRLFHSFYIYTRPHRMLDVGALLIYHAIESVMEN